MNVQADFDGIVRRVTYRTTLLETEGIASVAGSPDILSLAGRALERAGLANLIPSSREPVRIRFVRDFNPRSLYEIFVEDQWSKPPYRNGEFFRDKIVLIGASGNQTEDRLATPFGWTLGPAIHLSAINAALNRDFIYDPPLGRTCR